MAPFYFPHEVRFSVTYWRSQFSGSLARLLMPVPLPFSPSFIESINTCYYPYLFSTNRKACCKDNLFLHPSQLPTTFFRSFSFDLTFIRSSWCNSKVINGFCATQDGGGEPYDLRRWQRVGNRSRMHGSGKVQVSIFARQSVRLTLS